jgi:DNA-binding transcriptional LysR family regulator
MRDFDTALLRTFIVLAETASFSRTGQRIGRSQSAVSSQIKKLEDALGRTLLERDTRNVRLTADGERLLGYASQMVRTADAIIERFGASEIEGLVRFGAPEDFASAYLPGILGAFAGAHEKVLLHVACDLTLRLVAQFEAGEHDLIVVKQDPAAPIAGAQPLWREQLVWVAPPDLAGPFDQVRSTLASRSRTFPLVASPSPCVYRSRATAALDSAHIPWSAVYSSPSHAGAVAAVRAGLGCMVMPRGMAPPDLSPLDAQSGWPALAPAEICLLGGARPSPATEALARFICAQAPAAAAISAAHAAG